MNSNVLKFTALAFAACFIMSCSRIDDNEIAGTWQEVGTKTNPEILEISKNGEWHSYLKDYEWPQDRWGEYTYDASSRTIVVSIRAVSGSNSAYTDIYVIQHLSNRKMTLVCDRYSESACTYKKLK